MLQFMLFGRCQNLVSLFQNINYKYSISPLEIDSFNTVYCIIDKLILCCRFIPTVS